MPALEARPDADEVVAPADPKADFTPLSKRAGAGGSHFDPEKSKVVRRSLFETEYENPDGTRTIQQSTEPRNVKDPQGRWHEVDPSLETDARSRRVKAKRHPLKPTFGATADDPSLVTVEAGGDRVSLGLDRPAQGRKADVNGRSARYADVTADTDLVYEVTPGAVKETIRVKKPGASSWRFTLDTGGLTPVVTEQGTVELRDAQGAAKIVMPPVVTWDSSGKDDAPPAVTGGSYAVEKTGGTWALTVTVDQAWLNDPARVYPVSVDPTFAFGVVYSEAYKSDGYWCTNCGVQIGNVLDRGDKYWRSALRFDYSSMYGRTIVGAKVDVSNKRGPLSPDKTWPAHLYHASAMEFNGVGGHMASGMVGQVGTFTGDSLTSFLRHVVDIRHMATFLLVGHEAPGVWTYKDLNATLTVDTGSAPPAPSPTGPPDQAVIRNLAPTLSVTPVSDPDGDPVKYCFKVATGPDAKSGVVVDSGCLDSPTWTVPEAVLQDGVAYTWQAHAYSGVTMTPSPVQHFKIDQRIGDRGPAPVDTLGAISVNLANGNVMTSQSSPTFTTVGGSAGLTLSYNSQQQEPKGLKATYFPDLSHNGNINPGQEPVLVRTEPQVNVEWGYTSPFAPALPEDWFLARWEGYFQAPATGTYQFAGVHDDGLKVWVNGNSVYDQPCCSDVNYGVSTGVALTAGQRVPIKVELAEATGYAALRLFVRTSEGNVPSQVVPADWLYTSDLPVLSRGWTMSADLDGDGSTYTEAKVTDQTVVLTDGTGAKHTYKKQSTGGYTAPDGDAGQLSLDATGRVTLTEGSEVFVFRSDGKLEQVSNVQDARKPAALQNVYDGSPSRLKEIKDPVSGRSHRLHYNRPGDDCYGGTPPPRYAQPLPPEQMLCRITYWDGSETRFWYAGNALVRIEDPGGENTDYGYDANGVLDRTRDALANDWLAVNPTHPSALEVIAQIGYTTKEGKPYASSVTAASPSPGQAARPKHIYHYDTVNRATYVGVAGLSPAPGYYSMVRYDNDYRLLSTTDATGRTTSQTWNVKDEKLTSTDASGRVTTYTYDDKGRPVDTYGPAPASCFNGQSPTPACADTVPHNKTGYDEGVNGLAVSFYDNRFLSGAPKVHQTGLAADRTAVRNWGTDAPAAGIPADNFSLRMTGDVVFPEAGNYTLRVLADDGVRVWVNDNLVMDYWVDSSPTWRTAVVTSPAPGHTKQIRVEYYENAVTAQLELHWTTPGGVQQVVPATSLRPKYGLTTTSFQAESHGVPNGTTTTRYDEDGFDPAYGLATSTTAGGLTTRSTYEPLGTGYLRKTGKKMPTGVQIGHVFYGDTETRDNPCTAEVESINQGGLSRLNRLPTPATGAAREDEQVYDASGRIVAKGSAGRWTCTTYDERDRSVAVKHPATASAAERTVTTNYAVGGDPLVTSVSDHNGTVTTKTDLLGRVVEYTDANGVRTESSYDQVGRLMSEKVVPPNPADPPQVTSYTYDDAGRLLTLRLDSTTLAEITLDAAGDVASVAYANGSSLSALGKDPSGRVVSHTWRTADAVQVVSQVTRTRGGTIVDEVLNGVDARPSGQNYAYDAVGRLTEAWVGGHHYTYDFTSTAAAACPTGTRADAGLNTNRVRLLDETASGVAETAYCYDAADRLLATVGATAVTDIRYDDNGNTTQYTVDGATTHLSWDGADRNIAVRTTGADPADVSYVRDATDRIVRRTAAQGDADTDVRYGFTGSGDTADLTLVGADKRLASRAVSLPGGALYTWRPDPAAVTVDHPTVRGDLTLTTGADGKQVGGLREYGPFGEPATPDAVPDNAPGQFDAGWLGQHQRLYEHAGSLSVVQMGARPYSPLLGRFLAVDPVDGGSSNDYDYVNGDPVNATDLDGRIPDWMKRAGRWAWRNRGKIASGFRGALRQGAGRVFHVVRFVRNAPYTGPAVAWARMRGGKCSMKAGLMIACNGMKGGYGTRRGMTIGNVFLTGERSTHPNMMRHEAKHATQWAVLGPAFPIAYGLAELRYPGARNPFERHAGLHDGCYRRGPHC
ncbi:RHS repeat-associated protein [Saccharothrix variisporea]|uniref:RHS repeat-associated protein n=1 Tax=Saccharothrix variisporea TaxID=543527 RepID=A0A495XFA6_9PSEU|nr:RHS repeat-associated protein [Saccharothrix variisporea]